MISKVQDDSSVIAPHEVQEIALESLKRTRESGNNKGVVVFATGVGKTYLAAFDVQQMQAKRVLFIVHINEILRQSRESFSEVLKSRVDDMGYYFGGQKDSEKDIVFASIQTIGREKNITSFPPDYFDYIIVDETHHVAAPSYSVIFEYFRPKFFLGLTATPDRMDKKDILSHFDNNLVYEIDQKNAIGKGLLVPYRYFGFKDDVDYSDIRWNGYSYSITDLNKALMIESRDQSILDKYREYINDKKTIGFCVSIKHAEWMANLFNNNDISAIAIHSQPIGETETDLPRETKQRIEDFRRGKYQVAFVVNMFNEGVDIKDVEALLFLRPTESKTVFTQQMGRGLRTSPATNKENVTILDFIGNYKTATTVVDALGIASLGSLANATGDVSERDRKLLYQYDNNGSEVYFQDEVVDVLRELKSKESKEVDHTLIDEEWREYSNYVSRSSVDNLYFKIGQQNKHIPVQLEALGLISDDNDISEDDFINKMNKITASRYPKTSMKAGFRGLMLSKILGLADTRHRPTSVFEEIRLATPEQDYTQETQYSEIITRQFEKMSYWNPIFGTFNKYREQSDRVRFNVYQNYPVMFINLVIFELRNVYGYKDYRLSKEEIDFFIVFAQNLAMYREVAEIISRYREYQERPELRKMLKKSTAKADSRVFGVLNYVTYYEHNASGIKLKSAYVEILENSTEQIKHYVDKEQIIAYEQDGDLYLDMLYSSESFIDFHKNHLASI